jgi:hypothetical protein
MPMWRCPHCATPQPEAARCWVCHRSSTSCGTCRHFRRSVAGGLGFCGLDRHRSPLRGDELRGCWEAGDRPEPAEPQPVGHRTPVRIRREFVPLDQDPAAAEASPVTPPALTVEPAWALFPEIEP